MCRIIKFGGLALINNAVEILNVVGNGKNIIVVSALGRSGDCYATATLLNFFNGLPKKDIDRLTSIGEVMAAYKYKQYFLKNQIDATVIEDSGIITDENYQNATIVKNNMEQIINATRSYKNVIVPGFIAKSENGNITTLGRGGSDLSAVVIAHELGKDEVTLYKDVPGIYLSNDTKEILHRKLSYQQMRIMINAGSQVVQLRALDYASAHGIKILIADVNSNEVGTMISDIETSHQILYCITTNNFIRFYGQFNNEDIEDITWKLSNSAIEYKTIQQNNEMIEIEFDKPPKTEIIYLLYYYLKYNRNDN